MSPSRVLYVFPNSQLGGAEQLTLLIARHAGSEFKSTAYFLSDGPLVEICRRLGIETFVYQGAKPRLRRADRLARVIFDLTRVIRKQKTSLVHSAMSYGHLLGGPAALVSQIPAVWFEHGPCGNLDWVAGRIPAGRVFVNSQYTADRLAAFHPSARQISVIYPGTEEVNADQYSAERTKYRGWHGIQNGEYVFGIVGRLSPLKGHLVFLEAAAAVVREFEHARFLIIGSAFMPEDHAYEKSLRQRVSELNLERFVRFTGFIPPPQYGAMNACDAIVNASVLPEAFGMTLIEGMMLGKPVIGPRAGGPLEVIQHRVNGLLTQPGDRDELSDSMKLLIADPELSAALSAQGRLDAVRKFSVARMVKEVERDYRSLLDLPS